MYLVRLQHTHVPPTQQEGANSHGAEYYSEYRLPGVVLQAGDKNKRRCTDVTYHPAITLPSLCSERL